MIYHELAEIYDQLIKDDEANKHWLQFIIDHVQGKRIFELACGSGELAVALAKAGYTVTATDFSDDMLEKAKEKDKEQGVSFFNMNMLSWTVEDKYDAVICFCDSINYLSNYDELKYVFSQANKHLAENGVLLFDMHHSHRLIEFQDEWDEEGKIGDISYQWIIESDYDQIIHYFNFIKDRHVVQEVHVQTVFDCNKVIELLKNCGFMVEVFNDYDIFNEDLMERYFFVASK